MDSNNSVALAVHEYGKIQTIVEQAKAANAVKSSRELPGAVQKDNPAPAELENINNLANLEKIADTYYRGGNFESAQVYYEHAAALSKRLSTASQSETSQPVVTPVLNDSSQISKIDESVPAVSLDPSKNLNQYARIDDADTSPQENGS